ncbi:helix-hairpin-helix domain-containing protein [Flavobacterium ovatum]|uniref:ComEA family DNA-binding protein n=1 Tax=Flavobacterium ovatum TaxID=1928857 RepID=UPI00344BFACB
MKDLKSYFLFSKEQRNGIFVLVLLIVLIQTIWFFYEKTEFEMIHSDAEKQWLAIQPEIDRLKMVSSGYKYELKPFNPNFITDYKGYKLGMSVPEIDRLLAFRKTNQYVNSVQDFQKITQVSDSLLATISPYFKFPDWVTNKKEFKGYVQYEKESFAKSDKITITDVNTASQEDFMKINGIGAGYSDRIIKFRESLGGFVSMQQMDDVWGLPPEVITKLNSNFKIGVISQIMKLDINNASLKEIAQFPYFRYALAKEIVMCRSMNGDFKNATDLTKIKGLSIEKANIIALYLTF